MLFYFNSQFKFNLKLSLPIIIHFRGEKNTEIYFLFVTYYE